MKPMVITFILLLFTSVGYLVGDIDLVIPIIFGCSLLIMWFVDNCIVHVLYKYMQDNQLFIETIYGSKSNDKHTDIST